MGSPDAVEISQDLLDALPDGIVVVDSEGLIRLASHELAALSGYTAGELLGRPVELLIPDRYQGVHASHRDGYRKAGHPSRLMGSGLHIVLRARNGEEIPVDIALRPLPTSGGQLVVGAVRDARERVARERALRESEERYEMLINGIQDYAVFMLDANGAVASWNPAAERIKGYTAEEIIGRPYGTFFTKDEVEAGRPNAILALAARDGHYEEQAWRLTKSGRQFWADVAITALHDEAGNLRGYSKVTRDITESRRLREELGRLAILDDRERIGRELHDGVIQSLFGVGMSLQATGLTATSPELAERIDRAVIEIDSAIRDLRNYIFGLRPGLLADRQLDQAIRRLADHASEESELTVVSEVDPALAARLSPIAGDVVQLVREALSNVSRHAGPGTCRVTLAMEDGAAILAIVDDGRGFEVDVPGAGGQGLSNLRERVTGLGGSLEIRSKTGEGTSVRMQLPL